MKLIGNTKKEIVKEEVYQNHEIKKELQITDSSVIVNNTNIEIDSLVRKKRGTSIGDDYENNDSLEKATVLNDKSGTIKGNIHHPNDYDYYKIQLSE
ncbi:hypothetical protein, partial [Tepidibacter sp. Z1-5]|uniref:hypothetical protein n=1 Tax=Tepidibacter sp. Z1-5 TaxID=3134138 RepID=UPI0030BBE7B6